jgi:serine protease Do
MFRTGIAWLIVPLSILPAVYLSAQDSDALRAARALEETFQQVIGQAEESVACVLVARGEPYDPPPGDDPGRLGIFPGSAREKALLDRTPHLALTHPAFLPDQSGSAVALDPRGLLLTNYHVIREASRIYVRLPGGQGSYANIHAADPRSDLAVLKLVDERLSLKPVKLPDPGSALRKGQFVIALAHPFALGSRDGSASASWGILGNVRRRAPASLDARDRNRLTLHHYGTLLQTDARLHLGSSGGALFNLRGEMIGLTTSIAAVTNRDTSAGYAIPMDEMMKRLVALLQTGVEIEYGFLGIDTEEVPAAELMRWPDLKDGAVRVAGEPTPGTPAAPELRDRDILVSINGVRIRNSDELFLHVVTTLAGNPLQVDLIREGLRRSVRLPYLAKLSTPGQVIVSRPAADFRGLRVDYLTVLFGEAPPGRDDWNDRVKLALRQGGVVVRHVQPGSPAAGAGVQVHHVITHVNNRPVTHPADFRQRVQNLPAQTPVALTLNPLEKPDEVMRLDVK